MKQKITHRRLYAFYQSKVLNALLIAMIVSLLMAAYTNSLLLPVICSSLATLFFIAYALWLWIKKPASITINNWLSNLSGLFVLFYLIVNAMKTPNQWWYITPIALSVVALFVVLITDHDERFDI